MPGFFAPLMSLLALMALPIVVFYFLKLRRQRLEVSSLVLWQQVLSDSRVNAPFQKFKRNLLLLLQLLMLAMLVLAAMQPYWKSDAERAQRVPILIDCSASMAAMDRPGGQSRLDAAKAQVNEIIDGLLSDQQISLIAFSDTAQRLCAFTNNKRELKAALEQVKIREVPGDLEDAMRMADAMARAEPFEQVVLFSDGNFPAKTDFALPFNIDYQQLKSPGVNMGIATLNAQRADSRQWDV
ncbi:MAG: VWA domain-containing protein, partial [Phycisphaeraceae bacterium JB051]